jgi:hypothetical protein
MTGSNRKKSGQPGRGGGKGLEDARGSDLTEDMLAAIADSHSGLAEICVQEWAILLRCNVESPVAAGDLVASLLEWFPVPLSAAEISAFIDRLAGQGFLLRFPEGRTFQTAPLGEEVLRQCGTALIKGAMWVLTRKDEDHDEAGYL